MKFTNNDHVELETALEKFALDLVCDTVKPNMALGIHDFGFFRLRRHRSGHGWAMRQPSNKMPIYSNSV